jgi:hypothetical protein
LQHPKSELQSLLPPDSWSPPIPHAAKRRATMLTAVVARRFGNPVGGVTEVGCCL